MVSKKQVSIYLTAVLLVISNVVSMEKNAEVYFEPQSLSHLAANAVCNANKNPEYLIPSSLSKETFEQLIRERRIHHTILVNSPQHQLKISQPYGLLINQKASELEVECFKRESEKKINNKTIKDIGRIVWKLLLHPTRESKEKGAILFTYCCTSGIQKLQNLMFPDDNEFQTIACYNNTSIQFDRRVKRACAAALDTTQKEESEALLLKAMLFGSLDFKEAAYSHPLIDGKFKERFAKYKDDTALILTFQQYTTTLNLNEADLCIETKETFNTKSGPLSEYFQKIVKTQECLLGAVVENKKFTDFARDSRYT